MRSRKLALLCAVWIFLFAMVILGAWQAQNFNAGLLGGTQSWTGTNTFTQQIVSSLATGTAPFSVASTTNVANLNASTLSGATFAAPGTIGGATPGVATFTTLNATSMLPTAPQITTGADGTLVNAGEVRRVVYKITVSGTTCVNANGFIAASLNADCVIATFPAKTEITRVIVDNTVGFTCSATCTGTKTVQVGKTAGGSEYLVAKDVTVISTYGLANGDLGAALTTSATTPVGGGDLPSFSGTTTIKARYVSGTGNWGTGAATTVNAGSTTFYIETLVFP